MPGLEGQVALLSSRLDPERESALCVLSIIGGADFYHFLHCAPPGGRWIQHTSLPTRFFSKGIGIRSHIADRKS